MTYELQNELSPTDEDKEKIKTGCERARESATKLTPKKGLHFVKDDVFQIGVCFFTVHVFNQPPNTFHKIKGEQTKNLSK